MCFRLGEKMLIYEQAVWIKILHCWLLFLGVPTHCTEVALVPAWEGRENLLSGRQITFMLKVRDALLNPCSPLYRSICRQKQGLRHDFKRDFSCIVLLKIQALGFIHMWEPRQACSRKPFPTVEGSTVPGVEPLRLRAAVLNFGRTLESLGNYWTYWYLPPNPRDSDWVGPRWGLDIRIIKSPSGDFTVQLRQRTTRFTIVSWPFLPKFRWTWSGAVPGNPYFISSPGYFW